MSVPDAPKRRSLLGVYIIGAAIAIVVILAVGAIARQYTHDTAKNAATLAARVANQKLATAQALLAKQEHDSAISSWHKSLAACGRNNVLRYAIKVNTQGLRELEVQLAASRRIAATLEVAPGLAVHDRKVADGYIKLANALTYPTQVDCAAKYPDPYAPAHHR